MKSQSLILSVSLFLVTGSFSYADLSLQNGTMDGADRSNGPVPHWSKFESKKLDGENNVGTVVTQNGACVSDSAGKISSAEVGSYINLSFDAIKTHDTGITGVIASLHLDGVLVSEVTISKDSLTNALLPYQLSSYKVESGDVGKSVTVHFESDKTGEAQWNQAGVDNVVLTVSSKLVVATVSKAGSQSGMDEFPQITIEPATDDESDPISAPIPIQPKEVPEAQPKTESAPKTQPQKNPQSSSVEQKVFLPKSSPDLSVILGIGEVSLIF